MAKLLTLLPSYNRLALQWDGLNPLLPSILHGCICGILCGNRGDWETKIQLILNLAEDEGISAEHHQFFVIQLAEAAEQQLQNTDCSFQLYLPEDKEPLVMRLKALSLWCQAFLTGLGMAGIRQEDIAHQDIAEALKDLFEIAHLEDPSATDADKAEKDFIELVEYVRIAVILMQMNFLGDTASLLKNDTLH